MTHSSNRPTPPYYAVIFTSVRTEGEDQGYGKMAEQMVELAKQQPGFLGVESVRDANGFGITVSYWESEEAIRAWKGHAAHQIAQERGKAEWYANYTVHVAKVERKYGME